MTELKKEFIELRDAVNESAQLTKNQLESIKFQSPLAIVSSLGISFGLVYWLKIAIYWIPASFLIMYLWGLKGLASSKKSFEPENVEKSIQIKKVLKQEQINHGVDWFFLNLSNFAKATAIIYGVSLFILIAINQRWIDANQEISMWWPVFALLVYLPVPFLLDRTKNFIKNSLNNQFEFIESVRETFGKSGLSIVLGILKIIFIVILILGVILAPLVALFQTIGFIQDWLFFALVVILQFISIMILSSYYSGLTASRQLANTLTNYADINYQINYLIINKKEDEQQYSRLKRMYLTAKPYDILIDDSIQFLQFYYLIMNRTFMAEIAEDFSNKTKK